MNLKKKNIKSNYSFRGNYDLVILGAGIAGLSTGLLWLKNNPDDKVLIIEKQPYVGGFVTAYEQKGYVFETTQLLPDVNTILEYMGIKVDLKKYTGNFMRRIIVDENGGKKEYHLPVGYENLKKHLQSLFPNDARKIERLINYSISLFAQVRNIKALSTPIDKIKTPFTAPKVIANFNRTYSGLLDKFGITNPDLRELLETFTSFSGVSPSRASAVLTNGAMLSAVAGSYRPRGYFDEIPSAIASLYQELGGEILLNSKAEKITVKENRCTDVKISKISSSVKTGRVVSTLDPNVCFHELIGDEILPPPFLDKLNKTLMSVSSINVALGLDDRIDLSSMDLDYPYNVLSTGLGTTDKLFEAFLKGENAFDESCFHLGVLCPSLTTGGKSTVTIRAVPFALGEWKEWRDYDKKKYDAEKKKWGEFLTSLVEKYFIGNLSSHISVMDISTPATYARYSGSPTGSIYDMASLVTQFGPKRLPMQSPFENLIQVKFSHGIYGAMNGAVQVVDRMMGGAFNNGCSPFPQVECLHSI